MSRSDTTNQIQFFISCEYWHKLVAWSAPMNKKLYFGRDGSWIVKDRGQSSQFKSSVLNINWQAEPAWIPHQVRDDKECGLSQKIIKIYTKRVLYFLYQALEYSFQNALPISSRQNCRSYRKTRRFLSWRIFLNFQYMKADRAI